MQQFSYVKIRLAELMLAILSHYLASMMCSSRFRMGFEARERVGNQECALFV